MSGRKVTCKKCGVPQSEGNYAWKSSQAGQARISVCKTCIRSSRSNTRRRAKIDVPLNSNIATKGGKQYVPTPDEIAAKLKETPADRPSACSVDKVLSQQLFARINTTLCYGPAAEELIIPSIHPDPASQRNAIDRTRFVGHKKKPAPKKEEA